MIHINLACSVAKLESSASIEYYQISCFRGKCTDYDYIKATVPVSCCTTLILPSPRASPTVTHMEPLCLTMFTLHMHLTAAGEEGNGRRRAGHPVSLCSLACQGKIFLMSPSHSDSNLVLHMKAYHILTCSGRLSKQANLTGIYHRKGNDITNHRIEQEPVPSNSHSGPLEIILHLYVIPFFILRDFCEIPSVWGTEYTRGPGIAHRTFD